MAANLITDIEGVLVGSDRHLARYFKCVREFPRGDPPRSDRLLTLPI